MFTTHQIKVLAAFQDGYPHTVIELAKLTGLSEKRTHSALMGMRMEYVSPCDWKRLEDPGTAWELCVAGERLVMAMRKAFGGGNDKETERRAVLLDEGARSTAHR